MYRQRQATLAAFAGDAEKLVIPLVRVHQTGKNPNQGRLSRSVFSDKSVDIALPDRHVDMIQNGPVLVRFAQPVDFQYGFSQWSSTSLLRRIVPALCEMNLKSRRMMFLAIVPVPDYAGRQADLCSLPGNFKLTSHGCRILVQIKRIPKGGLPLCFISCWPKMTRISAVCWKRPCARPAIRSPPLDTPVLMLTALESIDDKERGFHAGADDYLVKPFVLKELTLRAKALLRRYHAVSESKIVLPHTELNFPTKTAVINGKNVALTKKEFLLLFKLLSNPNIIFSREHLLDEIWGFDSESTDRTVDTHIKWLRDTAENEDFRIVTVRGLGYKAVLL